MRIWVVMLVAAVTLVAAGLAGGSMDGAGAREAAQERALREAARDWDAALAREDAALDTAVAAYSAEREADGEVPPEARAFLAVRARFPRLTDAEVRDRVEGGPPAALRLPGPTPEETAAIGMFSSEPPETGAARERVRASEAASEAADAAERGHEAALEDLR